MILLFYVEHYFWLLMLILGIWTVIQDYVKIKKTIQDPTQQKLAQKLSLGQGTLLNLPWLVMGIGFLDTKVTTVFRFLQPFPFKIAVWAFYASVLISWLAGFVWIFFLKGDQILIDIPYHFSIHAKTTQKIRLFYILSLIGILILFAILFRINPVHFYQ